LREKKVRVFVFGPLEYQINLQESCKKKYNFAPGAAKALFFTHPVVFRSVALTIKKGLSSYL